MGRAANRSEEHTSELQSLRHLVCRLLLEKKKEHAGLRSGASGLPYAARRVVPLLGVAVGLPRWREGRSPVTRPLADQFPLFFFFNDTATTEIYTLSLHDALPISLVVVIHPATSPGTTPGAAALL